MSNSRKNTPGYYIVRSANKPGVRSAERKLYNRKWRRINKHKLKVSPEKLLIDKHDEVANKCAMIQDGDYVKTFDVQDSRK